MNHKITPTHSRTDCNKLCSLQSIIYKTLKNRKRIQLSYLLENSLRLLQGNNETKFKNKIICWSIKCKTSAVTLLDKLTNKSRCFKSPDYTCNGSIDTAVDAVSTEFSCSINRMIFFSPTDTPCPTITVWGVLSYSDNCPHRSPAYSNSYADAAHYLPCSSLLISVLINILCAKCPFLGQTDSLPFQHCHISDTQAHIYTQYQINYSIYTQM